MKKITIGFLGNLNFDTRAFNFFNSLTTLGNEVNFIGFDWLTEDFIGYTDENISITKLVKRKFSILFYLNFFFILLASSLKRKSDIYLASDFFSLPVLFITAKIFRKKIFYDSRELFTELPFHENKPLVRKTIKFVEKYLIERVDAVFTTGEMDTDYLKKLYSVGNIYLQRNLPVKNDSIIPINLNEKFSIPADSVIILYQGIVVKGRGLEIYFNALSERSNLYLIILGGGEHLEYYKTLSKKMGLFKQTIFAGKIQQSEILNYTAGAFAGLSVIDNIGINNYYALPNKLFEYLMAGIPVIVNNLPQMKKIVDEYKVGAVIDENSENSLNEILFKWKNNKSIYNELKQNCKNASVELNWENEFNKNRYLFQ